MDWFISITTLFSNMGLGWARGVWWIWIIHALNALLWIVYAILINQYGLIPLSVATIILDMISMYKNLKK